MRAITASLSIVLTVAAQQAIAMAQTAAPGPAQPGGSAPPPSAPAYPPPPGAPPAGQAPPAVDQPPPPGYQQPPPGYQQQQPPPAYQPPPGYQPPPSGYQPPPGYQQPPPPGYYQQPPPPGYYQPPPPGYYQPPPPGYYPPPGSGYPPPPLPPPPRTHGFLAMPYLGTASHVGANGSDLGPGFMIGALLGGRLNPNFSINGELRVDVLNYKNLAPGDTRSATESDIAFSPLFHVQFPSGELVIGPKFGFFSYDENDSTFGSANATYSASGTTYGVNAGVFVALGRAVSLGGMISYTVRDASQQCTTPANGSKNCTDGNYAAEDVLGLHAAMLF